MEHNPFTVKVGKSLPALMKMAKDMRKWPR